MIRNYLRIHWRNLSRQPSQTALHLIGLTAGIATALLIVLYLDFEYNFDRFNKKANEVYRVETPAIETHAKRMDVEWTTTTALLGPYMYQDYPEVATYARVYQFFQNEVVEFEIDGQIHESDEIAATDSSVFDLFSFEFIHGDPQTALNGPNKLVLAQSLAERIFGTSNPLGKTLNAQLNHILPDVPSDYHFIITGVYKDFPRNSHILPNGLISSSSDPKLAEYYFNRFSFLTYVRIPDPAQAEALSDKLGDIYTRYLDPNIEPVMKFAHHELVPLTQIHLRETGGYTYLYIFGGIALLVLMISIMSYVNLATAQGSRRAMEVGIRKVLGSKRPQLILQFLTESLSFSLIALALAWLLVHLSIPQLNQLLDLQLSPEQLYQPKILLVMAGILLLTGLAAGAYPAFFLSAFKPISVLKGMRLRRAGLRSSLVVIQFSIVIFVMICTGMIYEQLRYLQRKDLGFNRSQIVLLDYNSDQPEKVSLLKEKLRQSPNISEVGLSNFVPGQWMGRRPLSADNGHNQEAQFVYFGRIDAGFLDAMEIPLVDGRNFNPDQANESQLNVLINEQLAQNFGLKNPVGERLRYGDKGNPNFVTVVGLIEDFHQNSLHNPIGSQLFIFDPTAFHLTIRMDQNLQQGIAHMEKCWKELFPKEAFEYRFLDESLAESYQVDQVRGNLFLLFSGITILIAFMGLFGLTAYITRSRVKEIGIRKVLGANDWGLVFLLGKKFLLLISLAAVPAFLLAAYAVQNWLEDFAYRTEINYLIFGLVLLFTLILTLLTTGFHTLRATRINPAETLKYE